MASTPTKFVGQTYTAAEMLALYQQAEAEILATGQSKVLRGRTLTWANLKEVAAGVERWGKQADAEAARGAGSSGTSFCTSRHVQR